MNSNDGESKDKPGKGAYSAPALTKGLRIMELLGNTVDALTTQQIATALGYTRNEIFRFIALLEIEGYIAKDDSGQGYVLSGKLLELGLQEPRVSDIFELVSPLAEKLTLESGAPCHLAFPSQDEIFIVRRWEPQDRLSVSVPVGTRRAMEVTASGLSMLISLNEAELNSVVSDIQQRNPEFAIEEVHRQKAVFASEGYLTYESRLMEGVMDLSIPLVSNSGELYGALTVPYANNVTCESTVEEVGKMLVEICEHVSQRLIRN